MKPLEFEGSGNRMEGFAKKTVHRQDCDRKVENSHCSVQPWDTPETQK